MGCIISGGDRNKKNGNKYVPGSRAHYFSYHKLTVVTGELVNTTTFVPPVKKNLKHTSLKNRRIK